MLITISLGFQRNLMDLKKGDQDVPAHMHGKEKRYLRNHPRGIIVHLPVLVELLEAEMN